MSDKFGMPTIQTSSEYYSEEAEDIKDSEISRLTKERDHWKSNHDNRVEAARLLIERNDLPIERVKAYQKHIELQVEVAQLKTTAATRFIQLHETADKLAVAEAEIARLTTLSSQSNQDHLNARLEYQRTIAHQADRIKELEGFILTVERQRNESDIQIGKQAEQLAAAENCIGWVDVVDRLPTESQEVLFVRGDKVLHGAWIDGTFWHSNQRMAAAKWMPLPPIDLLPPR